MVSSSTSNFTTWHKNLTLDLSPTTQPFYICCLGCQSSLLELTPLSWRANDEATEQSMTRPCLDAIQLSLKASNCPLTRKIQRSVRRICCTLHLWTASLLQQPSSILQIRDRLQVPGRTQAKPLNGSLTMILHPSLQSILTIRRMGRQQHSGTS